MSHHQVNNKCNRVKRMALKMAYALLDFSLHNNVFLCNNMFSEATTTVLESFANSTGKHLCWSLFFLKIMKLYKDICSAWISWLLPKRFSHRLTEIDLWEHQKKKKINFITDISIYMVSDILKIYEVLFCTYSKGLFCL